MNANLPKRSASLRQPSHVKPGSSWLLRMNIGAAVIFEEIMSLSTSSSSPPQISHPLYFSCLLLLELIFHLVPLQVPGSPDHHHHHNHNHNRHQKKEHRHRHRCFPWPSGSKIFIRFSIRITIFTLFSIRCLFRYPALLIITIIIIFVILSLTIKASTSNDGNHLTSHLLWTSGLKVGSNGWNTWPWFWMKKHTECYLQTILLVSSSDSY